MFCGLPYCLLDRGSDFIGYCIFTEHIIYSILMVYVYCPLCTKFWETANVRSIVSDLLSSHSYITIASTLKSQTNHQTKRSLSHFYTFRFAFHISISCKFLYLQRYSSRCRPLPVIVFVDWGLYNHPLPPLEKWYDNKICDIGTSWYYLFCHMTCVHPDHKRNTFLVTS